MRKESHVGLKQRIDGVVDANPNDVMMGESSNDSKTVCEVW